MRRTFATNLIFLLAANLLIKPYWIFGIDRAVQNMNTEAYGTYFAVFNYSFLFNIIIDFGINNFNNRAIARNNKRLGEYLPNILLVKTVLSLIYFAVTFISALASGLTPAEMYMLLFLGIIQVLLSVILYLRSNIAALQLFKTDAVISILDRLLAIAFCLVLMYAPVFKYRFNIMWFIYAQCAALFITALIAFFVVLRHTTMQSRLWKFKFTRTILLKSMPFAMLSLLMGIYYRIDGIMIRQLLPEAVAAKENGIYAASFRLLDAVNMFGYLFATLLLPMFALMIRRRDNMKPLVRFSSELMFAGSVLVAAGCYFFSADIMHLLYKEANPYWYSIFGWLMLNFIPMSSIYVFGTLLTAHGSLKVLNLIAVGGALINILLNIWLIPAYGAFGATIATLITQVFAAIAHIIAANRQFGFSYEVLEIAKLLVFTALAIAFFWVAHYLPFDWKLQLVAGGAAGSLLLFALGIVPVKELKKLLAGRL